MSSRPTRRRTCPRFRSWTPPHDSFDGPHCRALRVSARVSGDRQLARLLGDDDQLATRQNSGFVRPPDEEWALWRANDDEHARRHADAFAEARQVREELGLT